MKLSFTLWWYSSRESKVVRTKSHALPHCGRIIYEGLFLFLRFNFFTIHYLCLVALLEFLELKKPTAHKVTSIHSTNTNTHSFAFQSTQGRHCLILSKNIDSPSKIISSKCASRFLRLNKMSERRANERTPDG